MKERKFSFHVQGGISLILLVFVVLSLLSFACLSIVSALSDLKQSRRFEERTAAYYRAYSQAQEHLYQAAQAGEEAETEETAGNAETSGIETPDAPEGTSGDVITKIFPVDEDENLVLQYRLTGGSVELLSERLEHIGSQEPDTSLSVLGGQGN
ncbi:MAG: hypothetical protein J6M46_10025 [Lachnospiraceae bacterium]|nr:hypothetical protein [Lachnospiraceae bacterium]